MSAKIIALVCFLCINSILSLNSPVSTLKNTRKYGKKLATSGFSASSDAACGGEYCDFQHGEAYGDSTEQVGAASNAQSCLSKVAYDLRDKGYTGMKFNNKERECYGVQASKGVNGDSSTWSSCGNFVVSDSGYSRDLFKYGRLVGGNDTLVDANSPSASDCWEKVKAQNSMGCAMNYQIEGDGKGACYAVAVPDGEYLTNRCNNEGFVFLKKLGC